MISNVRQSLSQVNKNCPQWIGEIIKLSGFNPIFNWVKAVYLFLIMLYGKIFCTYTVQGGSGFCMDGIITIFELG